MTVDLAQLLSPNGAPAAPAPTPIAPTTTVKTPAPPAAVSDAQMTAAASALDQMAAMFAGMTHAAAALRQIGSLGQAVNERQSSLNDFDTKIAARKAALAAAEADVQKHMDYRNSLVADGVSKASEIQTAAQKQADDLMATTKANASAVTKSASDSASKTLADANAQATKIQLENVQAQALVNQLNAQKTTLQGEISDLETKVSVARSSLRQLLGDSQ